MLWTKWLEYEFSSCDSLLVRMMKSPKIQRERNRYGKETWILSAEQIRKYWKMIILLRLIFNDYDWNIVSGGASLQFLHRRNGDKFAKSDTNSRRLGMFDVYNAFGIDRGAGTVEFERSTTFGFVK